MTDLDRIYSFCENYIRTVMSWCKDGKLCLLSSFEAGEIDSLKEVMKYIDSLKKGMSY